MTRLGFTGWALVFIFAFGALNINLQRRAWQDGRVMAWDVQEYYMLAPAAFIYRDLTFGFYPGLPQELTRHYSIYPTPIKKGITRRSIGMAIMYTPFFLAGHAAAIVTGSERTGFSQPYQFFIFISGFLYAFIGLVYLRKVFRRYVPDLPAALSLLCIALGSNLYYYTVMEGAMSHAHLFGLFSAFFYYTIRWHESPKFKFIAALGIIGALCILIRPTAIIIFLLFFLYGIYNRQSLSAAVHRFRVYFHQLLLLALIVVLLGLPQLIYWKVQTGEWLYYTYGNEGFFFNDPKIGYGLFSFRKGWLIYSPIMAFSLFGFIWLFKYARTVAWGTSALIILHSYIIFSWWCWWYGGSFGMRAMVEAHALLALPMAAFWHWALKRNGVFIPGLLIAVLFVVLNLQQTKLYNKGIIHWDSMTPEFYKAMLRENGYPWGGEKLLHPPDYDGALKGDR